MIPMDRNWHGNMTIKNVEQVVERLRLLFGGKKFIFVSANEIFNYKPQVELDQELVPKQDGSAVSFSRDEKGQFAILFIQHCDGVLTLSTRLTEDQANQDGTDPYLAFEQDKVTITHRPGGSNKVYWVLVVQK